MNSAEYFEKFDRTANRQSFHPDNVSIHDLFTTLAQTTKSAKRLDFMKKALFYNKVTPGSDLRLGNSDGPLGLRELPRGAVVDALHGILGSMTETAELGELLTDMLLNPDKLEQHRAKLIDEAGDVLWYLALLLRAVGSSLDEAMERNLRKLAIRYPDKFSEFLAVNRDDEAERVAFL